MFGGGALSCIRSLQPPAATRVGYSTISFHGLLSSSSSEITRQPAFLLFLCFVPSTLSTVNDREIVRCMCSCDWFKRAWAGHRIYFVALLLLRPGHATRWLWWPSLSLCLPASISETTCPISTKFAKFLFLLTMSVHGLPLAALRYVMYFRFYGWRHVYTHRAGICEASDAIVTQ